MRSSVVLPCIALLATSCCGASDRQVEVPQATLTVVDGRAAVGFGVVDGELVPSDPHCSGGLTVEDVGLVLVAPDGGEVLGLRDVPTDVLSVDPFTSQRTSELPTILGVGAAGPDDIVVALGRVGQGELAGSSSDERPTRIVQLLTGEGATVIAWDQYPDRAGISGWSAQRGELWHRPIETGRCGNELALVPSPDRSAVAVTITQDCRGVRTSQTLVLRTSDGSERASAITQDIGNSTTRNASGVGDDGRSLVWLHGDRQWLERAADGSELGRLDAPPGLAHAWDERWLIVRGDEATLFQRDGSVAAAALIEGIEAGPFVLAEGALWFASEPDPATAERPAYCVSRYDASLTAAEPSCFDEATIVAAYDQARSG